MQDEKIKRDTNSGTAQTMDIEISEKQIELFARRLLPDIKLFFGDEDIKREFYKWIRKRKEV